MKNTIRGYNKYFKNGNRYKRKRKKFNKLKKRR